MLIGYSRVSTDDQKLDLQTDALTRAGCEQIYTDKISGAKADRPGLKEALKMCRKGDTLVVWRLDRLGRSVKNLIEIAEALKEREIGLQSVTEAIDTTTSGGKLIFHVFGALAEFERNLLIERTKAGQAAARARGRSGGRPKALNQNKRELARQLYDGRKHTIAQICDILGVCRSTLFKYLSLDRPDITATK